MTTQFWWGLAMLPLGALALAITIFLPWFILAWMGDRRQRKRFISRWHKENRKPVRRIAAYVAAAKTITSFRGPLGWRLFILHERPGMQTTDPDARAFVYAVEDAIRDIEKETE